MKMRVVAATVLLCAAAGSALPACSGGDTVETGSKQTTTTDGSGTGASSTSIPDLGKAAGPVGTCLSIGAAYTSLALNVLQGSEGARKSQQAALELKAKLPADLADDVDVVAATFGRIADKGDASGAAELADPAYTKANDNIASYLHSQCGGG